MARNQLYNLQTLGVDSWNGVVVIYDCWGVVEGIPKTARSGT